MVVGLEVIQHHNYLGYGRGKMSNIQQKQPTTTPIPSGGSWILKDYRGFTVFEVTDTGDVKRKGRDIKL